MGSDSISCEEKNLKRIFLKISNKCLIKKKMLIIYKNANHCVNTILSYITANLIVCIMGRK